MRDDGQVRTALRAWRDSLVDLGSSCRLLDLGAARGALVEVVSPAADDLVRTLRRDGVCAFRGVLPGPEDTADRQTTAVLRRLQRTAQLEHLDRGVSVLHLAAGVLHWRDEEDTEHASPAVLLPVALDVPAAPGAKPLLRWRDDDPVVNPALVIRLRELGVDLGGLDAASE